MGALQNELAHTLARRGARPKSVKQVEMDTNFGGQPQNLLERFARRLRKVKPEPLPAQAIGYALAKSHKKGELLDIYA